MNSVHAIRSAPGATAEELEEYFDRLWPICRSITGDGVRKTLDILREVIPLNVHEVPTGTRVFDWTVPREWNIRDAYIITPDGNKVADFASNNLHVVNYSIPVDMEMTYQELCKHIHAIDDMPQAVPYVTSYYNADWGFCMSSKEKQCLPKHGKYRVKIDSSLTNGHLSYGDLLLRGRSDREVLLSTYVCHPSMANNELSGPLATAFLFRAISSWKDRKYSYRFVFLPETIGAITYLHENGEELKDKLIAGYVVTCVGDAGPFTYKKSRIGSSIADWAAQEALENEPRSIVDYDPAIGSDERQYCSQGFNLPVGSLMRSMYRTYPEYHTSLDNKSLVSFEALRQSVEMLAKIIRFIESVEVYKNANPHCEPQLGKRGLYGSTGGKKEKSDLVKAILWVLNYSDGLTSVAEIVSKSRIPEETIRQAVGKLKAKGLLK